MPGRVPGCSGVALDWIHSTSLLVRYSQLPHAVRCPRALAWQSSFCGWASTSISGLTG